MCEEEVYRPGEYEHTFYPLVEVLKKAESCGGCGFSQRLLDDYIGEHENQLNGYTLFQVEIRKGQ